MEAALRYNLLIVAAASAVANDPERVGSRAVARVPGVRAYSLRLSRTKLVPSDRVGVPRHLIIYRVATDGVVEILGLVHDRMVLSRAARRAIRDA
jgi:toxin ParE1/3/4